MSAAIDVRGMLEAERVRAERLADDVQHGRESLDLRRAFFARDEVRARAEEVAMTIERAARKDDVDTLAQAKLLIAQLRKDIDERDKVIENLRTQARTDALTGCLDRGGFEELYAREWSRALRAKTSLAVVFIDVDGFKSVNDQHGHQVGDATLQLIARTITDEAKRSGERVGRYGGDEFIVIVPQAELSGVLAFGERIRAAISQQRVPVIEGARLSVSVGVAAIVPARDGDRNDLVRMADDAGRAAKAAGKGRTVAAEIENGEQVYFEPVPLAPVLAPSRSGPRR